MKINNIHFVIPTIMYIIESIHNILTVQPEQPAILDMWGRILNGTSGPYEEGDNLALTCRVTGGT